MSQKPSPRGQGASQSASPKYTKVSQQPASTATHEFNLLGLVWPTRDRKRLEPTATAATQVAKQAQGNSAYTRP